MQVADVGISLLGLPLWTGRLVFLLLAISFPLVMVFSWAYEITPEGLKRESEVPRDGSITNETARKLNTAVIVLLLLALGGMVADRLIPEQAATVEAVSGVEAEAGGPSVQSIAVLPFVNMSADEDNEYFSDGLSEELLNLLAKIPGLQVAARTSAFSFKGVDASIPEIAGKLNVAHVLEGSVRKSGDEIRITAQLIKAADGYHLWSETWDRTLVDVFAIQDEIAAAVVAALKVTLLGDVPHTRVTDPRAYELYLQAKAAANLSSRDGFARAALLLTDALAIDPEYAEAWAELGSVQTNQTGQGFIPVDVGFERARLSAERALKIDPNHARAMSGLGWNAMYREWDFAKAAQLIRRARELEPGNASVLNANAVLMGVFGRRDQMISLYEDALERDPVAMSVLSNLTGAYFNNENTKNSAALVERMRAIEPNSEWVVAFDAWLTWRNGDAEAALDMFTNVGGSMGSWGKPFALYDLGRDDEIDEAIQALEAAGGRPTQVAGIYAYMSEHDKSFAALERAYEERDDWLIEIRMFRFFEPLHDDPRWEALLQRIGISDTDAEKISL
jgi:TolB-like protein/tetratricopeptide (TPR) repeat protein